MIFLGIFCVIPILGRESLIQTSLSSKSAVLEAVDPTQKNIIAENVNYFLENDGTIKIDDEVIYYEKITHSPDIIFTPVLINRI